MSESLFCQRLRVGLADRLDSIRMSPEAFSATQMALGSPGDVQAVLRPALGAALDTRNGRELLRLFWSVYAPGLLLNPVACRLLVNPPVSLTQVNAQDVCTLHTQGTLCGAYGDPIPTEGNLDLWMLARERGGLGLLADDVTVFYDEGVNLEPLLDRAFLLPGTTVTLVRPVLEAHHFWMAWAGVSLHCERVLRGLDEHFTLRQVYEKTLGEVHVLILGLEARSA